MDNDENELEGDLDDSEWGEVDGGWFESDDWNHTPNSARQEELQSYLDRWEAEVDHGKRRGPF